MISLHWRIQRVNSTVKRFCKHKLFHNTLHLICLLDIIGVSMFDVCLLYVRLFSGTFWVVRFILSKLDICWIPYNFFFMWLLIRMSTWPINCKIAINKSSFYDDHFSNWFLCVTLLSSVKPTFGTFPQPLLKVDVDTTVSVQCSAHGIPRPTVTWFRNAQDLASMANSSVYVTVYFAGLF